MSITTDVIIPVIRDQLALVKVLLLLVTVLLIIVTVEARRITELVTLLPVLIREVAIIVVV